jgi:superfamily II DNA or RNA helicase
MTLEQCIPGTRVRVIGAPERCGEIRNQPRLADNRWIVKVMFDDGFESSHRLDSIEPVPKVVDILDEIRSGRFEPPEALRRNLLNEKLNGRLSDMMYSMEASNTTFLAYQFKPVLKLLESPTNSLLIADEVGLGKTIEAGLIWTELRAREGARSLLVVCPAHLVTKWRNELKNRFGVDATAAGPKEVLEKLEDIRRDRSIPMALVATYPGLRPPKGFLDSAPTNAAGRLGRQLREWADSEQPFLDLLVMDEAAIMRNETSQTSKLGELLGPIAKHKVYLSATPLHTKTDNLYNLLRRLDPDTFPDIATFRGILDANRPLVNLRNRIQEGGCTAEELISLVEEASSSRLLRGNRALKALRERLEQGEDLSNLQVRAELAYQSERANLLSYVVTRTRRRDVDTKPVIRAVHTVKVPLNTLEQQFYQWVTQTVDDYSFDKGISSGFLTVMPQRQVASCMAAACARLRSAAPVEVDESAADDSDEEGDAPVPVAGTFRPLMTYLREAMGQRFHEQDLRKSDSKYGCLLRALKDHWKETPNGKVVLFAYFKPTLRYLAQRLFEDGISSSLLTGDEVRDKQEVINEFAQSTQIRILLSSEVGSEGLDLQFAGALVNYDLPWNPMVVEQRIGRIHRIGQLAERIVVINLICEDTVDERIYDRLYQRLDLFRNTVGDLETVVGPVITLLTRELTSSRLTPGEQESKIEAAALALETSLRQEQDLERDASVLAAYGDYVVNRIAESHGRGEWLRGDDIEAYIRSFFRRHFPQTVIRVADAEKEIWEITLDSRVSHEFDEFVRLKGLRGISRISTGDRQRIRFDHRVFRETDRTVETIHQSHPLVRFVGDYLRRQRLIRTVVVAAEVHEAERPPELRSGLYAFITHRWSISGLRDHEKIHHQVINLETGEPLADPSAASLLVDSAASRGHEPAVPLEPGDSLLTALSEQADDLDFEADAAFHRFLDQCKAEDEDRREIQLRGIDRFEERRTEALKAVQLRHRNVGRASLAAAIQGQIDSLHGKCERQRDRIRGTTTGGHLIKLAAGFICVH